MKKLKNWFLQGWTNSPALVCYLVGFSPLMYVAWMNGDLGLVVTLYAVLGGAVLCDG